MLSDEDKIRIAKKAAEAAGTYKVEPDELLGPAYEGVCKACEICTSTVTEELTVIAYGYARRYVRRMKFGSKADSRGKWNPCSCDERDQNIFNFNDFKPLDLLYVFSDIPYCVSKLTPDEQVVVNAICNQTKRNIHEIANRLQLNDRTVLSRWESALEKIRHLMGVTV